MKFINPFVEFWPKPKATPEVKPGMVWVVCPGCNGSGVIDLNACGRYAEYRHIAVHESSPDFAPCKICGGALIGEPRPLKGRGQVLKYVGPRPARYHRLSYSSSFFSFRLKLFRHHWPPGHYDSQNERFLEVRVERWQFRVAFWPDFIFTCFLGS